MNPFQLFVPPILLILSVVVCLSDETIDKWTTFGAGKEAELFSTCFIVSFPSDFTIDPTSGILPDPEIRKLPVPEENLHTLILRNDDASLEVRASSYGFLTKAFYAPRGFVSPREVILVDHFRNALKTRITRNEKFDLFCSEGDSEVVVIFLNRDADWGSCDQSLRFSFRKGTTRGDHDKTIEQIIEKFIPHFARPQPSPAVNAGKSSL